MRKHAAIEVEKSRGLYRHSQGALLEDLFDSYERELCFEYKRCFLYALVRNRRPLTVVETGVAAGISSYAILQALQDNGQGHLYSIDLPDTGLQRPRVLPKGEPTGFLVPGSLRKGWTLRMGDSKTELPRLLRELETIDFFIHDSLHEYEHMTFEYRAAWPRIRRGGMLFSDDVDRNDAFQDFCKEVGVQGTVREHKEEGYVTRIGWVEKPSARTGRSGPT